MKCFAVLVQFTYPTHHYPNAVFPPRVLSLIVRAWEYQSQLMVDSEGRVVTLDQ